ncbi:hypothetical protein F5Y02DRAFT_416431 [Annulohypoxylon stygium]|nr:hypothetical protein F5Y02DRAFT_416431 [Annulohypoxylon stygium]
MPNGVFYFDPPGPPNFKAPWLTFSSGDLLTPSLLQGRAARTVRLTQGKTRTTGSQGDRAEELPRHRQRPKTIPESQVISLISSDDEGSPRSHSLAAQSCRENRRRKESCKKISQEEVNRSMTAAKRLSRAAITSNSHQRVIRPALSEITARQSPRIKRFGTYTNSFELTDRKMLVELGILSPKRPRDGGRASNGGDNFCSLH